MANVYLSEADAARDFGALLDQLEAGVAVYIERADGRSAVLAPGDPTLPGFDPEYDRVVAAKIDRALADPAPVATSDEVEAYFAKRRAAAAEKSSLVVS